MSEYGIAIDIGTTTVSISLHDIETKAKLDSRSFDNPQQRFGEDIISRIHHQLEITDDKSNLTSMIRESINSEIFRILSDNKLSNNDIQNIIVVGNTVMHHLFFDLPLEGLLSEPFESNNTKEISISTDEVGLDLPEASCYSPPLIGSFIGSDALAVIIGFGVDFDVHPTLLLDIGTNSEIIIQYYGQFTVASAASGPAFEGMALECGMKALPGAIDDVHYDHTSRSFGIRTIGNKPPIGICGIGAISALHQFRRANLVSKNGSIHRHLDSPHFYNTGDIFGIQLLKGELNQPSIYLNQMDIRMLQQSKAAIRAVVELLFIESNCSPDEIKNLYITGAFGNGLNLDAAQSIGMLPNLPNDINVHQKVGGAIFGAELLLLSRDSKSRVSKVKESIRYVDMMNDSRYEEIHSRFAFIQ